VKRVNRLVSGVLVALCVLLPAAHARANPPAAVSDADKVVLLRQHLDVIHDEARSVRLRTGGVLLGIGILGAAGALYINSLPTGRSFGEDLGHALLVVGLGTVGVAGTVTGGLILLLPSDDETEPEAFEDELERRAGADRFLVDEGERTLRELAESGERWRIISGIIFALLPVPSLLGAVGSDASTLVAALPSVALFGGLAVYEFVSETTAEEEWDAYQSEAGADGQARRTAAPASLVRSATGWWVAPSVWGDGVALGAGATF